MSILNCSGKQRGIDSLLGLYQGNPNVLVPKINGKYHPGLHNPLNGSEVNWGNFKLDGIVLNQEQGVNEMRLRGEL